MKEYDIFIPLYYNDGSPIEAVKFQDLQSRLLKRFAGLTYFPQPNKGFWKAGKHSNASTCHCDETEMRFPAPNGAADYDIAVKDSSGHEGFHFSRRIWRRTALVSATISSMGSGPLGAPLTPSESNFTSASMRAWRRCRRRSAK